MICQVIYRKFNMHNKSPAFYSEARLTKFHQSVKDFLRIRHLVDLPIVIVENNLLTFHENRKELSTSDDGNIFRDGIHSVFHRDVLGNAIPFIEILVFAKHESSSFLSPHWGLLIKLYQKCQIMSISKSCKHALYHI